MIIHYCGKNRPWKPHYVGSLGVFYEETKGIERNRLWSFASLIFMIRSTASLLCCPDSCCKRWDVAVDAQKAALPWAPRGAGEKLREFLQDEDGDTYLTLDNGRCPMWRADGLCRIQAELGSTPPVQYLPGFPKAAP